MTLVGRADAIAAGTAVSFNIEGRPIAVANVDGRLFAFDDICTHLGCSLSDGMLEGMNIACQCHYSVFQIADGSVVSGPATDPIQTHTVEVVDGQVSISLVLPD